MRSVLFALVIVVSWGSAQAQTAPERLLFREAARAQEQALVLRGVTGIRSLEDAEREVALHRTAVETLRRIVAEYPDSEIGTRLRTGAIEGAMGLDQAAAYLAAAEVRAGQYRCAARPDKACLAAIIRADLGAASSAKLRGEGQHVLVGLAARAGRHAEALAEAEGIEDPHWRWRAVDSVARALARAGKADEALAVLRRIDAADRRDLTENAVAVLLAEAGEVEAAVALARAMPAPGRSAAVLAAISTAASDRPLLDAALAAGQAIGQADQRDIAAAALVPALLRAARADEALVLARGIRRPDRRARALGEVAVSLNDDAVFDEAREAADSARQEYQNTTSIVTYAWQLALAGRIEAAKMTVGGRVFRDDARRRDSAALRIALVQIGTGDLDGAADTLGMIEGPEVKEQGLGALAVERVKAGRSDEGLAMARGLSDATARVRALISIAMLEGGPDVAGEAATAALNVTDRAARLVMLGVVADALPG